MSTPAEIRRGREQSFSAGKTRGVPARGQSAELKITVDRRSSGTKRYDEKEKNSDPGHCQDSCTADQMDRHIRKSERKLPLGSHGYREARVAAPVPTRIHERAGTNAS